LITAGLNSLFFCFAEIVILRLMDFSNAKRRKIWKHAPFLRHLFPLIAGILLQNFFPLKSEFIFPGFFLCLVLIGLLNHLPILKIFGLEWVTGIVIQFAFFSFGKMIIFIHRDKPVEQSACYVKNQPNLLLLRVLGDPVQKSHSYKCIAAVNWLITGSNCYREDEKVIVYFKNKGSVKNISDDSWIITRKGLSPIENSKSSDFDYKKYCSLKHIQAQIFLQEHEFALLTHEPKNSAFSVLNRIRRKLLIIIKNEIPSRSENSLLEALMVGFTDDLDPELLRSYADTGVIHIIAISGVHLALICHILQLGLQNLGQKKAGRWAKLIIIVTCLWGYSFLSGASPSVIRAAAMFSLVFFARNILRETILYNSLAASAFLLLSFDPFWIWDTGFQLSYAAVLSLRLFSKPVNSLIVVRNKILVSVWNAASVTIAAQLLSTPISIYYFHRFPSYFLLANIPAVPLSSAILVGGILLCICSSITPLTHELGRLVGLLIQILNKYITHISKLPGAVVGQLVISLPQLILIYLIIFSFYRFLISKEKFWLLTGLFEVCIFQIMRMI
jgi:competence protein ComEC